MAWPEPLASLNLVLSSASGMLGHEMMGDGTETFDVESGNVLAQWFGTAQGPLNAGVYGIKIEFQPSNGIRPWVARVAATQPGVEVARPKPSWGRALTRRRQSTFVRALSAPAMKLT